MKKLNKPKTTINNVNMAINENRDRPPMMGTNHNEVDILYKLTDDAFSYVPSDVRYWSINTDNTLFTKAVGYYSERDSQKYKADIAAMKFFFIYYINKRYIYIQSEKVLYDKHMNRVNSSNMDSVFNQQMNDIIHNTLKKRNMIKTFEAFESSKITNKKIYK